MVLQKLENPRSRTSLKVGMLNSHAFNALLLEPEKRHEGCGPMSYKTEKSNFEFILNLFYLLNYVIYIEHRPFICLVCLLS